MIRSHSNKGSALITVLVLLFIMGILTTSMLRYTGSEHRLNERQRLILRSRNMTENTILYASEQITNKLYKLRSSSPMAFMGANNIALPPDDVLTTSFSAPTDVEVRAGLTATTGLMYIDPENPANAANPNAGLQISNSTVPIVGKATMHHAALGAVTTYAQQTLEVSMMPLFQFAIFYNMDLEFGPGPNMTISGPVHTNGDFISRIQTGFANTIRFTDRVTSAKGFYANTAHRGSTYMANGAEDTGPGGSGPLIFRKPTEAVNAGTDIKSSSGVWRDHKWGGTTETETTLAQFRAFATSTYAGNFRTSVHGVTKLVLPAIGDYDENDPVKRKNGRQIIDPPASTDAGGVLGTKFSRNAGLYIIVNPDDVNRVGKLPDGSDVMMRARSYRAWLNTGNNGSHTLTEVVLPGQPSYGDLNATANNLPNAYRVDTSVGHNQILRIPQGGGNDLADTGYAWTGTIPDFDSTPTPAELLNQDAYFYDTRRAANSLGFPSTRTTSNRYRPRPIAKIDFDFTRFKMAVERTYLNSTSSTIYHPGVPSNDNWASNVLNSGAARASYNLGLAPAGNIAFSVFPTFDTIASLQRTQSSAYAPAALVINAWRQLGVLAAGAYAARFKVDQTTNPTIPTLAQEALWTSLRTFSTADESSITVPAPAANTTFIRVRLYKDGVLLGAINTNNLCDEQIIPITSEATANATAALTNDGNLVPTQLLGLLPILNDNSTTDMQVFVGGADDTANWAFRAVSTGITGRLGGDTNSPSTASTGKGTFANRYTVSTISAGGGPYTVTITASKTGYTSLVKTFTLEKQSNRTSLISLVDQQTGRWLTVNSRPSPDPFRIYRAPVGATELALAATNAISFAVAPTDLVHPSNPSPWYDGITVYVHSVDAEDLTVTGTGNAALRNRVSSGVRLWNGRGPLVSLSATTNPGRTGFSFVTNDALYIMGHYNADGNINSTITSTGTGGYSGRYPESTSEMLTSVMGDAISIFSQPEFSRSGAGSSSDEYRYYQTSGWSDSLSASRRDDSANYSSSWASTSPSNSNTLDGLDASIRPAMLPSLTVPTPTDPSTAPSRGPRPASGLSSSKLPPEVTEKFAPSETEISACLLTGIVPTVKSSTLGPKQTSGGVHNFPRLSENWAGSVALYIRGSLVAMFESQVATEPWGIRYYQGAIRNWGLHESLRDENHDVPLEPIVLGAQRMSYRELTPAQYATEKAVIQALPYAP